MLAVNCVSERDRSPIQRRPGIGYTFNMISIVHMTPQPPHLSHPSCGPLVVVGVFAFDLSIHFGLTIVWLGHFLGGDG